MPRHTLKPIPRSGPRNTDRKFGTSSDEEVWNKLDRVQVLGDRSLNQGHTGCVNALSWSDDGSTLLSGSDDKRICIWGADSSTSNDNYSPHPLKLVDTIQTGHRANIFSAKYLPNTLTPTIVSCAGDSMIKIFEVERLGRAEIGRGNELWGQDGTGVRTLKCHTDRTKRIATENSPHLFLTVSEDGSVRQHDLRRPHRCRDECPEALFYGPVGVDLYSLSVSTVTPHMFCVAGRTRHAFVCDRRMLSRQTPSWGDRIEASGHVHCVRRLGLTDEDWRGEGGSEVGNRRFYRERHVTCVKMSPDQADEVIVAFASHSTSLFSIYDDPATTSARTIPPAMSRSEPKFANDRSTSSPKSTHSHSASKPRSPSDVPSESISNPSSRKRPRSEVASPQPSPPVIQNTGNEIGLTPIDVARDELQDIAADMDGRIDEAMGAINPDLNEDDDSDDDDRRELAIEIDSIGEIEGMNGDFDFEFDEEEEIEDDEDEDWFDEEDTPFYQREEAIDEEFAEVDVITPRRSFKGARNVETVKDCNFLGLRSDKVCSGSDDGNFFVWDKATGRLDGIWEGDGSVVNVMEQHPTLPLVAVSGIDDTVKMFAPPVRAAQTSFSRLALRDRIISANLNPSVPRSAGFSRLVLTPDIIRRLAVGRAGANGDGDDDDGQPCTTQ